MFDSETRWLIRCDTCPDDDVTRSDDWRDKDTAAKYASRVGGWEIRDGLHRCPWCVREGRTEMAT